MIVAAERHRDSRPTKRLVNGVPALRWWHPTKQEDSIDALPCPNCCNGRFERAMAGIIRASLFVLEFYVYSSGMPHDHFVSPDSADASSAASGF